MSSVLSLFAPKAQRIVNVRRWFVDQAVCDDHVAALAVAVTADGRVTTSGCSIDAERAKEILCELRALVQRLESQLPEERRAIAETAAAVNLIALRPGAAKKAP